MKLLAQLHKILSLVHLHGLSVEQMLILNTVLEMNIAKVPASADAIGAKLGIQPRAVRAYVQSLAADAWVNVTKGGRVDTSKATDKATQFFTALDRTTK
jgi:predicted ArsR family transcriptional regulator